LIWNDISLVIWTKKDGVIISIGITHLHGNNKFAGRIKYTYEIDGKKYTSSRISNDVIWGDTYEGSGKKTVKDFFASIIDGRKIDLLYNPTSPSDSVLTVKSSLIMILSVALLSILFLLWPLLRPPKTGK